jgi:hypothetical protein
MRFVIAAVAAVSLGSLSLGQSPTLRQGSVDKPRRTSAADE